MLDRRESPDCFLCRREMTSSTEPLLTAAPQPTRMGREPAKDWDSPAYEALKKHGLLRTDWRVSNVEELDIMPGNTTPGDNCRRRLACGGCLLLPWCKMAEVPAGAVRKLEDGRGGFAFLGNRGPNKVSRAHLSPLTHLSSLAPLSTPAFDMLCEGRALLLRPVLPDRWEEHRAQLEARERWPHHPKRRPMDCDHPAGLHRLCVGHGPASALASRAAPMALVKHVLREGGGPHAAGDPARPVHAAHGGHGLRGRHPEQRAAGGARRRRRPSPHASQPQV